ncbi:hypothetical protein GUJ93_ZPchr0013g34764 [Zizania palustris]|uniref:Cysteine-rich transmembrane domain-containing protein n=1 Tax=Zizania palustris TaxID=103762 RepID=A0A8J6C4R3_ZIZPA|nr:hypothetical protein GUJ93_ZPchr0013g34764 [Zizania palustris]
MMRNFLLLTSGSLFPISSIKSVLCLALAQACVTSEVILFRSQEEPKRRDELLRPAAARRSSAAARFVSGFAPAFVRFLWAFLGMIHRLNRAVWILYVCRIPGEGRLPAAGYPPAGYPPPAQGYPPAGYPQQGYPPPYAQPPPPQQQQQSSGPSFMEGCLAALCCCCLLDACF